MLFGLSGACRLLPMSPILLLSFDAIFRGLITSAGKERAVFSAIDYTYFCRGLLVYLMLRIGYGL